MRTDGPTLKPVPNCPGRSPGQFGTRFGSVRIRFAAKTGAGSPVRGPEALLSHPGPVGVLCGVMCGPPCLRDPTNTEPPERAEPPRTYVPAGHQVSVGDLWMWLQLMCLQFEVVRGPVGIVWDRFGAQGAPNRPQIDPKRPRPDLGQSKNAPT